jgi:tRNA (mo5U34)-methyltransferase
LVSIWVHEQFRAHCPIDGLGRSYFRGGGNKSIADIGAADGDLAFFMESLGNQCDIYDFGPTNYNGLRGAYFLKERLKSNVGIYERDFDSQFSMTGKYDLIFFLGILSRTSRMKN